MQRLTGDVFRLVGSEEQGRICDVLRFAKFTQRSLRFKGFAGFFRQGAGHIGVDKAWGDAVDGNAAAADFARHRFGETDQACFCRGIVGLTGIAHHTDDGCDVDDASGALLHHAAQDGFGGAEHGFEVDLHDVVPLFFFHTHQEVVAGDAGVVDQNIQLAELFFNVGNQVFDGFGFGGIQCTAFAAPLRQTLANRRRAAFAGRRTDNFGTCRRQRVGNRRADTARCACYQCDFAA